MKVILSNIVLFCGGANVKFLRDNCPNERHKFYPIGLGVIITSALGFISMMFATHSIFGANSIGEEFVLILFSLFWAFAIFTIDWGLVKTMRKPKNEDPTILNRIKSVVPVIFRIIVAIILSYSISRPLEVKVYEKRLRAQIEKDRQDFITREWNTRNEKVIAIENQISNIAATDTSLLRQKNEGPKTTAYKTNAANKTQCELEYKSLYSTNTSKIASKEQEKRNINSSSDSYYINPSTSMREMKKSAKNRIFRINKNDIPSLKNEISQKKKECEALGLKIEEEEKAFRADFEPLIRANSESRIDKIFEKKKKEKEDSLALADIRKASYVSFDTLNPGLITQIESMSNFEKTPEGKSAGWVRFILLLVIICIDTAPIIVKLLTKRGVYEDMQDADEDRMKFLTKQEGYSNNHLITQLALAQKEILTEAVKRWRTKEKDREGMEDDYVNSNQQNNSNGNL
jgi:hypothetical protein